MDLQRPRPMTRVHSSSAQARFTYRGHPFVVEAPGEEEHILKSIKKKGCFYELPLLEYVFYLRKEILRRGAMSLDVGANIGNHSIYFARFLCTRVLSVEPNPSVTPFLESNLEANSANCLVLSLALGNKRGRGHIRLPEIATNNLGMAQIESTGAEEAGIRIETLDGLLPELRQSQQIGDERVALLKVDVEGMELSVLEGARGILKSDKPELLLEAASMDKQLELVQFLGPLGYEVMSKSGATPMLHFSHQPSARMRRAVRIARAVLVRM